MRITGEDIPKINTKKTIITHPDTLAMTEHE